MPILVNIRHLEQQVVRLDDEASVEAMDLESKDELIRFEDPVTYHLEVQRMDQALLVQGVVAVEVECECARCLRTFRTVISLPHWIAHLPLKGDEAVTVENDCVDLTPYLREDILLALPQHPLCSSDCQGLLREYGRKAKAPSGDGEDKSRSSPWGQLDNLDL